MHLYVHIPFCRVNCSYCNFYFSVNRRHEGRFFDALLAELQERKEEIAGYGPLQTVYLGGGTPSLAHKEYLEALFEHIRHYFPLADDAEITLEANPDDISRENLRFWKDSGINRLSVGVQSFRERDLQLMRRAHTTRQSRQALDWIAGAGFRNVTIDLIYGIPGMSTADWEEQLDIFLSYGFPHLSAYALTVEPDTLLARKVQSGAVTMPADEVYETQFFLLREKMLQAGYAHYEISNFARPGWHSRHNSAYWEGHPYVGLGPSAHSYDGKDLRRWNKSNLHVYMRGLENGGPYYETEKLSAADLYNEYLMTRLRTGEGVDVREIKNRFPDFYRAFVRLAETLEARGDLCRRGNRLWICPGALFRSDGIIAEFFVTD